MAQQGQQIDDNYQYTVNHLEHMGIPQRWMVVHSKAAGERAKKTITKQVERDKLKFEKDFLHLQAQRFACKQDALKALKDLNKQQTYHNLTQFDCLEHKTYEGKGRPKKDAPVKSILWQVCAEIEQKQVVIQNAIEQKSCFVLATNVAEKDLSPEAVLQHYKSQSAVERRFRFLKDPLFFVSSLFIKKPSRIDALLMIMTLSLLVYSIAQLRMRMTMKQANETIPSQINQPNASPTLRWVFQCFEGINLIELTQTTDKKIIYLDGYDHLREKIIQMIGGRAMHLYNIQKNGLEV